MAVECEVFFDRVGNEVVYHAGELVSGRIRLTLHERQLIKALGLKICGYASTFWEKPAKVTKKNATAGSLEQQPVKEFYVGREDYLSITNYYIGSEDANPKIIENTICSYDFAIRLPERCPTSFIGPIGFIKYELEVFIDYSDHVCKCYTTMLNVQGHLNLCHNTSLAQPLDVEILETKSFSKLFQRPMQLFVNIPRGGYIPGEDISVHVKVLNYTQIMLTELIYKLNLVATFTGYHKKKSKVRVERMNMAKVVHGLFGKNGSIFQHLQMLRVPATAPTTTDVTDCKCIQIAYEIDVTVTTEEKKRTMNAQLPIKIGTVSLLSGKRSTSLVEASVNTEPSAPFAPSASTLMVERLYDNQGSDNLRNIFPSSTSQLPTEGIMPPYPQSKFMEADFMSAANFNKNKKHTNYSSDGSNFKPKYLYYEMDENIDIQPKHVTINSALAALKPVELAAGPSIDISASNATCMKKIEAENLSNTTGAPKPPPPPPPEKKNKNGKN